MAEDKVIKLLRPERAIAEILHYAGNELAAKEIITDGLRSGKLSLMARYAWVTNSGDVRGEWEPRRYGDYPYEEDAHVDASNFRQSAQWPEEVNYWRWDKGEFVIFLGEDKSGWGRFERLYMQDVAFYRDEVMALFGRSKRGGGRKSDRDRWAIFWINVLRSFVGNDFDWTQYDSRRELKRAFISANEHFETEVGPDGKRYVFSDNNLDFAVEFAWNHLVEPAWQEAVKRRLNSN